MTRSLGLALVPRADHIDAAVALQRRVGSGITLKPILDSNGNLPHVTIYQGPILDSVNPQGTLYSLKAAMSLDSSVSILATEVYYQPTGWIFLGLQKTAFLEKLQSETVTIIEGCIDQSAIDRSKDVSRYTELEKRNYYQYGYRYVGDAFMPHITIGRGDEESAKSLAALAASSHLGEHNWVFDRLTFYGMGEHGAHAEILAEESLRQEPTIGAEE